VTKNKAAELKGTGITYISCFLVPQTLDLEIMNCFLFVCGLFIKGKYAASYLLSCPLHSVTDFQTED
jgi:hypothetical protein